MSIEVGSSVRIKGQNPYATVLALEERQASGAGVYYPNWNDRWPRAIIGWTDKNYHFVTIAVPLDLCVKSTGEEAPAQIAAAIRSTT